MIVSLSLGLLDPAAPSADYWLELMRAKRDEKLFSSDWTQLADSPLTNDQKEAWAVYRQQLRDFPSSWTPAPTADFPDPPT